MKDVTAAVITNHNQVLLTRRAPGEKHAGWWEFPGGKVEENESPERCLQRELLEELSIETSIGEKLLESLYTYETGDIRLLAYRATITSGDLCLHVHDEYRWVSVHMLTQYQLLPADIPIAEFLQTKQTPPITYTKAK
ncbi:MAG: (deoxy)nucleoside triphosphate pyrophosphohydrolase [Chitinivibrionales bacterium]|nr:(deoxy)nucleoside triphosphate pyrophosphohydrolase [Chitinivibrionales bacterium]